MRFVSIVLSNILLVLLLCSIADADENIIVKEDKMVVFDLRSGDTEKQTHIYSFVNDYQKNKCAGKDVLLSNTNELSECTDERMISHKGDVLDVVVLCDDKEKFPDITVDIEEKKRNTQLQDDIKTAISTIKEKTFSHKKSKRLEQICREVKYTLGKELSTLSITVKLTKKESSNDPLQAIETLVTGPEEHFFLSLDVPVNKIEHLKFDSTSGTITQKTKPSTFYAGINYMVGDVRSDYQDWYKGFVVKTMFTISKNPLESLGVGVGYRFNNITMFKQQLNNFVLFGGRFWTKEDRMVNGILKENDVYTSSWVVGVSYSFDGVGSWVD